MLNPQYLEPPLYGYPSCTAVVVTIPHDEVRRIVLGPLAGNLDVVRSGETRPVLRSHGWSWAVVAKVYDGIPQRRKPQQHKHPTKKAA